MLTKWVKVFKSVSSSMLGVQSHQNYEEDFTQSSSAMPYIVVGVVMVAFFVFALIMLVKFIAA